jgi:hypothetical protein
MTDAMAQAAAEAAQYATALGFHLHGAASPTLERALRAENLAKAMRHWAPLIRAMSRLSEAAPAAAAQAEKADHELADFMERQP